MAQKALYHLLVSFDQATQRNWDQMAKSSFYYIIFQYTAFIYFNTSIQLIFIVIKISLSIVGTFVCLINAT